MKIKYLSLLAFFTLCSQTHAENLLQAFQAAQSHDAQYASAQANHLATLEKLPQGKALLLPNVNLSANHSRIDSKVTYSGNTTLPSGESQYNSHGYSLNLIQPVYRKQNWQGYSIAELQVELSKTQLQQAQQELILRVAQAYFDALMAEDSLQLTQAQKQAIGEQLAQVKKSFAVGTATITDTQEAQARFDLTEAQEINARSQVELKHQALALLTGHIPDNLKRLRQPPELKKPQPDSLQPWQQQAANNNYQSQIARLNVELASQNIRREQGGQYPTLDLVASYSNNSNAGGVTGLANDTKNTTVGLQFNLPIYQGGGANSKIREAQALHTRSQHEQTHALRTVEQQTRQAYLGVTSGIAQINALQQALISSESALHSSQTGQKAGLRTNVEVLNAQQQVYSTRRELYQAQYNYIISQLQLQAAVGNLNEASLQQLNSGLAN